jgi:hypothetical protein
MAESAGKPPKLFSHPGVVTRKLSVVRNIATASPLPTAEPIGQTGRASAHFYNDLVNFAALRPPA